MATTYTLDTSASTSDKLTDVLYQFVIAGPKTYDIPTQYVTNRFNDQCKLVVTIDTTYVKDKKEYSLDDFTDKYFDGNGFSRKKVKFQRKMALTATINIPCIITGKLLTSTTLTTWFMVNHSNLLEGCLGLRMYGWDTASNEVTITHSLDNIDDEEMRNSALLFCVMAQKQQVINEQESKKLMDLFSKMK